MKITSHRAGTFGFGKDRKRTVVAAEAFKM